MFLFLFSKHYQFAAKKCSFKKKKALFLRPVNPNPIPSSFPACHQKPRHCISSRRTRCHLASGLKAPGFHAHPIFSVQKIWITVRHDVVRKSKEWPFSKPNQVVFVPKSQPQLSVWMRPERLRQKVGSWWLGIRTGWSLLCHHDMAQLCLWTSTRSGEASWENSWPHI